MECDRKIRWVFSFLLLFVEIPKLAFSRFALAMQLLAWNWWLVCFVFSLASSIRSYCIEKWSKWLTLNATIQATLMDIDIRIFNICDINFHAWSHWIKYEQKTTLFENVYSMKKKKSAYRLQIFEVLLIDRINGINYGSILTHPSSFSI